MSTSQENTNPLLRFHSAVRSKGFWLLVSHACFWMVANYLFIPQLRAISILSVLVLGLLLAIRHVNSTTREIDFEVRENESVITFALAVGFILVNSAAFLVVYVSSKLLLIFVLTLPVVFLISAKVSRELLIVANPKDSTMTICAHAVASAVRNTLIDIIEFALKRSVVRDLVIKSRNRSLDTNLVDSVLLVSHSYIGDAIMQTPAIELMARAFPRAEIILLTNKSTEPVFRYNQFVTKTICCLPPHGEYPSLSEMFQLFALRKRQFALCLLDFNGSQTTGKLFAWMTGPAYIIAENSVATELNFLINECVSTTGVDHHTVRNVGVIENSTVGSLASLEKTPPLTEILTPAASERSVAELLLTELGVDASSIVIGLVVGSADGEAVAKRWPLDHFAELCRRLNSTMRNVKLLAFKGPQESDLDYAILEREGCITISGHSLLEVAAIISSCNVLLGNDSGLGHVAASLDVPTITIFGPTNPDLVRPYSDNASVLRIEGCPPCMGGELLKRCGGARGCIVGVSPELAFEALAQITGLIKLKP